MSALGIATDPTCMTSVKSTITMWPSNYISSTHGLGADRTNAMNETVAVSEPGCIGSNSRRASGIRSGEEDLLHR
jgi:hypothetical protein